MGNVDTKFIETVMFIIYAIKQFCFGFEKLDETADDYADGSVGKAFYMTAVYQYLSIFYLLDQRSNQPMGGTFYKALSPLGLESLLDPMKAILAEPLGQTTFGEVVRIFRNKGVVHPNYHDADLDRIYEAVDMEHPEVQKHFQQLLVWIYLETKSLAITLAKMTGHPLSDFGITEIE
jgi:hypothetical protein